MQAALPIPHRPLWSDAGALPLSVTRTVLQPVQLVRRRFAALGDRSGSIDADRLAGYPSCRQTGQEKRHGREVFSLGDARNRCFKSDPGCAVENWDPGLRRGFRVIA